MHYLDQIAEQLKHLYTHDFHGLMAAIFSFAFNCIGLPYQAYLNWRAKSVKGFGALAALFGTAQAWEMSRHEWEVHFDIIVFVGCSTGFIAGIVLCIQFWTYSWWPKLAMRMHYWYFIAKRRGYLPAP